MDVQNALILPSGSDSPMPIYLYIAHLAQEWNVNDDIGIIVGAAHHRIISMIRTGVPDMWFLSSGINTQNVELELALKTGLRADGKGMLMHVSNSIAHAVDAPVRLSKAWASSRSADDKRIWDGTMLKLGKRVFRTIAERGESLMVE